MALFQLQFKDYQFSPNLIPTLVTLIMLPALIALGIWQLNRADQKRLIDQGISDAQKKPPLNLNQFKFNQQAYQLNQEIYRSAILSGHFDNKKHYLLDNRTYKGKAGFHVLTPYIFNDARHIKHAVLINRGWVPVKGDRTQIPNVSINDDDSQIRGRIKAINKALVLSDTETSSSFPMIIQSLSLDKRGKELNYPLLPIIIELDSSQNNGFTRDWKPYYGSVDRHIAYALQWFAMAIVLIVLFIKINTHNVTVTPR